MDIKSIIYKYFELIILSIFVFIWVYGVAFMGLPVCRNNLSSFSQIWVFYVHPLVVAIFIQVIFVLVFRKERINSWIPFLYLFLICIVIFLHFNFKAWTPLINPMTYDTLYYKIDNSLGITLKLFNYITNLMTIGGKLDLNAFYSKMFVAMFFLSFTFHLMYDSLANFRKVVIGVCLILLVGGISYWAFPAVGPFIFDTNRTAFSAAQEYMYSGYITVTQQHFIPVGYFNNAPAAMPSLHVSHSFFLMVMALRKFKPLGYFYIAVFIGIFFVSVASRWHYIIDLPFGLLISVMSIWIVDKVYEEETMSVARELVM